MRDIRLFGFFGFGLGCSPLKLQSLIGIKIGGTRIPIKDWIRWAESTVFWGSGFRF